MGRSCSYDIYKTYIRPKAAGREVGRLFARPLGLNKLVLFHRPHATPDVKVLTTVLCADADCVPAVSAHLCSVCWRLVDHPHQDWH